jgi:hypothetical protein
MSEHSEENDKPEMPAALKRLGTKAIGRHERRPVTPPIEVVTENDRWTFSSPFRAQDEDEWVALLFEAFGTRSEATFRTFTRQLAELCSTDWNDETKAWHPNEDELLAAVQIVRSTRPRNEAEACLSAQMVAVHLMQVKLSAQTLKYSLAEPRTCAIAAKLARTYAMQLETFAKLKGRGSRQRITVRKFSQHEHKHIHIHQGGSENGNQPHGPRETRTAEIKATGEYPDGHPLPGAHSAGHALPTPCDQREEAVSPPRRRIRIGSADG